MPTVNDNPSFLALGTRTDDDRHEVVSVGGRKQWGRVQAEAADISGIQSTINSLSERLTTSQTKLDQVEAEVASNRSSIQAIEDGATGNESADIVALRNRVDAAENAISTAQNSIATIQGVATAAQTAAAQATQNVSVLAQAVSDLDGAVSTAESAVSNISTSVNNLSAEVQAHTADIIALQNWKPTVDQKLSGLQSQIDQIDSGGGSGGGGGTFVRRNREWDLAHELQGEGLGGGGDDAAIINAFISQQVQAGDRLIFTPPVIAGQVKEYRILTAINIDKPMDLIGQGPGNTVVNLAASENASIGAFAVLSSDVTVAGFEFFDPGGIGSVLKEQGSNPLPNFDRWTFSNCHFRGTTLRLRAVGALLQNNTVADSGTRLEKYIDVIDCEFSDYVSDYTAEVRGNFGTHFNRCYFHDYGTSAEVGEGLKVLGGSENTRISHSKFRDGSRDGIDIYDSLFSTVEGCEFERLGAVPIETKWNDGSPNECRGMRILNNTMTECNFVQLASHEILIQGNQHRRGKHDTGSSGIGFRVGPSNHDVNVFTRRAVVVDNLVEGSVQHGIQMTGVTYGVIAHNTIRNAGGYGINASPTHLTSIGNHVENPAAAHYNYTTTSSNRHVLGDTSA